MSKIMMSLALSTLLLLSACTEKKKEEKKTTLVEEKIQKETSIKKKNDTVTNINPEQVFKPFKPSIETNMSENIVVAENLEELESAAFKAIQPHITEEMGKIPDCLERAETKEEAFACSKALRALNKELAMAMGDFNEEAPEGYDDEFVWNEETKVNMIKEIDAGTQAMQEMQTCMEISKTSEELEKCLKPQVKKEKF